MRDGRRGGMRGEEIEVGVFREGMGIGQEGVNGVETGREEAIKRSRGVICKEE